MKGGSKDYWFVLTAESLSWFKDEEVILRGLPFCSVWQNRMRLCGSFHHWVFLGEGEKVHAASGQPETEGRGERIHVQQAHLRHLQY